MTPDLAALLFMISNIKCGIDAGFGAQCDSPR